MASRKLIVQIVGDASSFNRAINSASNNSRTLSSRFSGLGKAAAFAAGTAGIAALTAALKIGVDEWIQNQKVAAQTRQVLASTGGVAKVTAKHVEDLAGQIMRYSGIDDEAVQATENLLLAFTNIHNEVGKGNDIFDRATKVIIDYSVRTGKDARSAAQLFGKALNEIAEGQIPAAIRGVGKLSDEMKTEIKQHLAAGDAAGAQAVLLQELERRYGGAAKAAGETLPGKLNILREQFNNLAGQGIQKAIDAFEDMRPTIETFISVVQSVWPVLQPLAKLMIDVFVTPMKVIADLIRGDWTKAWQDFKQPVMDAWNFVTGILSAIKGKVGGYFSDAGTWLVDKGKAIFEGLRDGLRWYWNNVIEAFYLDVPRKIATYFAKAAGWLLDEGKAVLHGMLDGVKWYWNNVVHFWWVELPSKIAGYFTKAATWLYDEGKAVITGIKTGAVEGWRAISEWFTNLPSNIGKAVLAGAKGGADLVSQAFQKIFGKLWGLVKDVFGIASPSKEFAYIGKMVIHGLVKGIEDSAGLLRKAVEDKIMAPIDWVKGTVGDIAGYVGDLFTGGAVGSVTGRLQLPAGFSPTHDTMGLAGYPAIDEFAAPGTIVLAPAAGTIQHLGGRPFSAGWSNGPGSAIGFSMHLASLAGDYFLTHFGSLFAGEGAQVGRGTPIGVVGDMDSWGVASHIHEGFHRFALGGIVRRPTLGLIGEKGPEAVIPLNRIGGGTTIHVHVAGSVVTEQQLQDSIYRALVRRSKANAGNLGLA